MWLCNNLVLTFGKHVIPGYCKCFVVFIPRTHAKLHVTSGCMLWIYFVFSKGANNHVAGNEFISDARIKWNGMEWEKRERMKRNESKWKQKFEKPKSKRVLPVTLSWFDIVIEKKRMSMTFYKNTLSKSDNNDNNNWK